MNKNALIAGGAAVILLVTAACGSKSTTASSPSSSASSAAASVAAPVAQSDSSGAMTSAEASAAMSSAPESSAMISGPESSEDMTSGPETSGEMTSGPETSGDITSGPESSDVATSGGGSGGALSESTTTFFTTLCTGLEPLKADAAAISAASGETGDAAKLKAISGPLIALGKLYADDAASLNTLPDPDFTGGSEYATKTITSFSALAQLFDTAGTAAAQGDGSKVKSLQADANASPAVIAAAKFPISPALKAMVIAAIPVCGTSGAFE